MHAAVAGVFDSAAVKLNAPALGKANFLSSGRKPSSSSETERKRSATPFTVVI